MGEERGNDVQQRSSAVLEPRMLHLHGMCCNRSASRVLRDCPFAKGFTVFQAPLYLSCSSALHPSNKETERQEVWGKSEGYDTQ